MAQLNLPSLAVTSTNSCTVKCAYVISGAIGFEFCLPQHSSAEGAQLDFESEKSTMDDSKMIVKTSGCECVKLGRR